MRITILQGAFLPIPPLMGGAVEKIWYQLGREFASLGHTVTHISRSYPGLVSEQSVDGVHYLRVPGFKIPSNILLLKFYDLLYSLSALFLLPDADILITNTFWMPILRLFFKPFSGLVVVSVERMPKGQIRLYQHVPLLRCCSSVVRERVVREVPTLSGKALVIPNPLPFHPPSSQEYSKDNVILYCGRIHPEKGIDLLLASYLYACSSGLSKWVLRIVGPSDFSAGGGGHSWLKLLRSSQNEFSSTIQWVGPIYDNQGLQSEYQKASIFVYPTLSQHGEAMPIAPLEAMAFGAVPVVSSLSCFNDYIQHNVNGLFFDHRSSNSVILLAHILLKLSSDPTLLSRLSSSALSVRHTHHPFNIAKSMLTTFEELRTSF